MSASARPCPICLDEMAPTKVFLRDTIVKSRIVGSSFASRKTPEYMSHAMVRCLGCDVAYVDQPPSETLLAASYHSADYDSAEEAEDAADAYLRVIQPVLHRLAGRSDAALEIGTGTGAFLARLGDAGFRNLVGIEPSVAAIAAARADRRSWIREGIFVEADFASGSFDLICCFMTLEHVREPGDLVSSALRLLKPGGALVVVTHDFRAPVNRILGRRSPIVDLEHMQLFSARSAERLLASRGFIDVVGGSFRNAYRPSYWLRLAPIPSQVKSFAINQLQATGIDRVRLAVNVGNRMTSGFKPPL